MKRLLSALLVLVLALSLLPASALALVSLLGMAAMRKREEF